MSSKAELITGMQDNLVIFNTIKLNMSMSVFLAIVFTVLTIYLFRKLKERISNIPKNSQIDLRGSKISRYSFILSFLFAIGAYIYSGVLFSNYTDIKQQLDSQKFQLDNIVANEKAEYITKQQEIDYYKNIANNDQLMQQIDKEVKQEIEDYMKNNPEEFEKMKNEILKNNKSLTQHDKHKPDNIQSADSPKSPDEVIAKAAEEFNNHLNTN